MLCINGLNIKEALTDPGTIAFDSFTESCREAQRRVAVLTRGNLKTGMQLIGLTTP